MKSPFISSFTVREYEIDSGGGMPHSVFLNYYQQARHELLLSLKFPFSELQAIGVGFVVMRIEVDYMHSLLPDENFTIYTEMIRISKLRFRFEQTIYKNEGNTVVSKGVNIGTVVDIKTNKLVMPEILENCLFDYPVVRPKKIEDK